MMNLVFTLCTQYIYPTSYRNTRSACCACTQAFPISITGAETHPARLCFYTCIIIIANQILFNYLFPLSDLLPGKSYTVYISSENCITDQLSEKQLANITASIDTSTLESIRSKLHNIVRLLLSINII